MNTYTVEQQKQVFFSQYLFQKVLRFVDFETQIGSALPFTVSVGDIVPDQISTHALWLRPMTEITVKEAYEVCKILDPTIDEEASELIAVEDYRQQLASAFLEIDYPSEPDVIPPVRIAFAFDYLRQQGFAVPWGGYSVDQLVEMRWVILI